MKYTVVYTETNLRGSHTITFVMWVHITCESPSHIKDALLEKEIEMSQVWVIFDGHCQEQK